MCPYDMFDPSVRVPACTPFDLLPSRVSRIQRPRTYQKMGIKILDAMLMTPCRMRWLHDTADPTIDTADDNVDAHLSELYYNSGLFVQDMHQCQIFAGTVLDVALSWHLWVCISGLCFWISVSSRNIYAPLLAHLATG